MKFKNQIAIVTGGSKGIGYGIAEKLALQGAKVYLMARKLPDLKDAQKKIQNQGGQAEIIQGDITWILENDKLERIIDNIFEQEGRLDIVVENAGEYAPANVTDEWSDLKGKILGQSRLNDQAPHLMAVYLVNKFRSYPDNNLKILNVLSQAAAQVFPGGSGYGHAKMAFLAGIQHLNADLKEHQINNIQLYNLYPGTVATETVLALVKEGLLQNPTSVDSVVDTALDLLMDKTKTKDVYVGYSPTEGIRRIYFAHEPPQHWIWKQNGKEIIDKDFDPGKLLLFF